MTFEQWIEENNLAITPHPSLSEGFYSLHDKTYLLIKTKQVFFTEPLDLVLSDQEIDLISTLDPDYICFRFGNNYYYSDCIENIKLKEFKYIGESIEVTIDQTLVPFLAIHGAYDLCNGSRLYQDWCNKAKFLCYNSLGIAEENTLAGWVEFNTQCKKAKINPLFGTSLKLNNFGTLKLYVYNETGYTNLILISNLHRLTEGGISIDDSLFSYTEGLVCIVGNDVALTNQVIKQLSHYKYLFYQIDFAEWDSSTHDKVILKNYQIYFSQFRNKIKPIFCPDAYFLDKKDYTIRKKLNEIGNTVFKNYSKNLYFKSIVQWSKEGEDLFDDKNFFHRLVSESLINAGEIEDVLKQFSLPIGILHLPSYELSENEQKHFTNNEDFFWYLLEKGFEEKIVQTGKNIDIYSNRLQTEVEVISEGGFIDYFLILADIIRFCQRKKIWTGLGRGSAAGSLVTYLLGITLIDPLEYNLLFERFLNRGRIKQSIKTEVININGDIDLDLDEKVVILRNGKEQQIKAKSIEVGDEIISIRGKQVS